MVKNTGGNKSKKVARKNVLPNMSMSKDVRRVSDPSELYAAVSKIYSGRRCDVMGSDGNTYACTVRGKFLKGKGSSNALSIGIWVMVGFYDWEVRSDGKKNCDLLEIYTPAEKEKLKQLESHKLSAIMNIGELEGTEKEFAFSNFKVDDKIPEIESSSEEEEDEEGEEGHKGQKEQKGQKGQKGQKEQKGQKGQSKTALQKQETPQQQNDWLAIDERDI